MLDFQKVWNPTFCKNTTYKYIMMWIIFLKGLCVLVRVEIIHKSKSLLSGQNSVA